MKDNILKLGKCYGCGVCVKACPVKIISLQENEDGFYAPAIADSEKCIECGMCLDVCAFNHTEVSAEPFSPDCYAAWSNDAEIRNSSASGGVTFEIAKMLFEQGYLPVGVRYNPKTGRAEHYIADSIESLRQSMGSKYIPSYTVDALMQIDRKKKYMFVGTPCQVDSVRRYFRRMRMEDSVVLIDFFCHGVPSLLMWDKYLEQIRRNAPDAVYVSWRNKSQGWHNAFVMTAATSQFEKPKYASKWSDGDIFYRLFLDNYCLNQCCYTACKYKLASSAADIRVGDLWGSVYSRDEKGVSGVMAITEKGKRLIANLNGRCTFQPVSEQVVTEEQMAHCPKQPRIYDKLMRLLKSDMSLEEIKTGIISRYRRSQLPQRVWRRLKSKVKKSPK